MEDEMIQVPLSVFEDSYLPPKSADFDDIVRRSLKDLEKTHGLIIRNAEDKRRFTDFEIQPQDQRKQAVEPDAALPDQAKAGVDKQKKKTEPQIFKKMVKLWNGMKNEGDPRRNSSLTYHDTPFTRTASETKGGSHIVDAVVCRGHLSVNDGKIDTHGVVVAAFYKPLDNLKDRADNATQALGAATFTMNDDPTRNWTYSITIENTQVRLWFWSRSHCAVSEPFSFVEDVKQFVKIMARFMFADLVELGYNPHIRRLIDDRNRYFYVYKMGSKFYKTVGSIYEQRSLCISSRATRVWKVRRTVSETDTATHPLFPDTLVLRDVWLERTADTEMQTQVKIFADIDAFAADIVGKSNADVPQFEGMEAADIEFFRELLTDRRYREMFLTLTAEHSEEDVGSLSKPCAKGDECRQIRGLFYPPDSRVIKSARETTSYGKSRSESHEAPSSIRKVVREPEVGPITRPYDQKKRSMSLCKEVCEPLHDLRDMSTFIQATLHCLFAVIIMWFAGWIHRDISTGNILTLKKPNEEVQGKLSDLEYARKINRALTSGPSSDPKTGTAYFMAIEIHSGRRITITSVPQTVPLPADAEGSLGEMYVKKAPKVLYPGAVSSLPERREPVRHSFLHDMESFFWIVLWAFTGFVADPKIRTWAAEIFVNSSICPPARQDIFINSRDLYNALMANMTQPFKQAGLGRTLEATRQALMSIYTTPLSPNKSDASRYCRAFYAMAGLLRACTEIAETLGDKIVLSLADPTARRKRGHPDSDHDDSDSESEPSSDTERPSKLIRSQGQEDVSSTGGIWRDMGST